MAERRCFSVPSPVAWSPSDLIATASHVGTAFYAFGLILLPALAFIGMVTCERVVQSGTEDYGYARRIALLRGYYFDQAPGAHPLSAQRPS